jgi:PPE-repeat protein
VIGALDFAAFPPEFNSARMYAGAGPGSLVTAATAWGRLAAELNSAATSYRSVLSALTTGPWMGPSSSTMAAAVSPYVSWINATAAQAQETASQLGSAVTAYEAAFAATVPPAEIEVNRALLASLVSTNVLGQNTAAIAATEAHYSEMWAQDAAVMYGYAASSAAATTLGSFSPPPPSSNQAGTANQAAAVVQAAATPAGTAQSAASQMAAVPNILNGLSSGTSAGSNPILDFLDSYPIQTFERLSSDVSGSLFFSYGANFVISGALLTFVPMLAVLFNPLAASLSPPAAAPAGAAPAAAASLSDGGAGSPLVSGVGGGASVSAGLGDATTVGKLSVPQSWSTSPAIRLAATATALSGAGLEGVPQAGAVAPGFYGGMPPMGPVASVVNAPRGDQGRIRAGARQKVIPAFAGETGMHDDPAGRWVKPTADADDDAAVSERDELNQLRKAIADVTRQRDVLKRTAANLIKEATTK